MSARQAAVAAAAQYNRSAGSNAGRAAQQLAAAGPRSLQQLSAHFGRHAARHLAHGSEKGERAVGILHVFEGDRCDAGGEDGVGEVGEGRQVEEAEENELRS